MFEDLNDLYQQVILDHSRSPRNFKKLDGANRVAHGHNPLCGDRITVYLHLDGDVISDISFEGSGCAISKASASVMTTTLKGKTIAEAQKMFAQFRQLVTTDKPDGEDIGKLAVFAGVHKFPARVKCAILAWHALVSALEGRPCMVTTEENPTAPKS
ncbi:MAG: SUF system NifU family Fe-S cluster assembly protein [Verrucomicrobia bacterium]|nr:SUF system NifU family Fe-S cluster assembly protein [Verrucomicrobiota bacterium]